MDRSRIAETFETGLRAVDGLVTVGKGQRMGVFSGSGVGKSTLLGEIARNSEANVNVIALIGERGREVREFVEKNLGEEGLQKSVVVVATSDRVALQRVTAGFVATTIAEYFRDQGQDVLLVMDSLSRLAWSLREIGLAVGEPPTTRGYTPSVFATLPRLVERCGQADTGTITGIYSVLVEGDDFNEPIADAARSFLDGHITLSRARASRGYYPSIDVLESVSRTMTDIVDDSHRADAEMFRRICATYRNAEDVIDVGVYVAGTSPEIDRAIAATPLMEDFLRQPIGQKSSFDESAQLLSQIMATATNMDTTGPVYARGTAA